MNEETIAQERYFEISPYLVFLQAIKPFKGQQLTNFRCQEKDNFQRIVLSPKMNADI